MARRREARLEAACRDALALLESAYTGRNGEWIGYGKIHGPALKAALEPEPVELHAGHVVVCEGEIFRVWETGDPLLVRRGGLIMRKDPVKVKLLTCATCGEPLVSNEFVLALATRDAYFDYCTQRRVVEPSEDDYYIAICDTCYRHRRHKFPEGKE